MTKFEIFNAAYEQWQQDCLTQYNKRYGENRILYHHAGEDYEPGNVVEFSEDGTAYPHGRGGTNYIPNVVTPWEKSEHYIP